MAAKTIKSLELHYTMIQFLINENIVQHIVTLPKYGHGELNSTSSAHNRYPAKYVVFVCQGEKWQSAF